MQSAFASSQNPLSDRHVMVVVAHPDDETIGAGACLAQAKRITLVHVTDGGENSFKALLKGYATRDGYVRARQAELRRAFSALPVGSFVSLEFRDLRAVFHIAKIAAALRRLATDCRPDLVLTHAFEGGHPDHDATAMATHLALRDLNVPLLEMTGYNHFGNSDRYGVFVPQPDTNMARVPLSTDTQSHKKTMLAAFTSQKRIVARFPLDAENFRPAPRYDFTRKPHDGPLFYEKHKHALTWRDWVVLANRAMGEFSAETRTSSG